MNRIMISVSGSRAVISKSCQRVFVKIARVKYSGVSSGDKVRLVEDYEKKMGDIRIQNLRQETQHMRRRRVPERLSQYSKKLSFSFHNIVRTNMVTCEDVL